jgi:hypothetical protein
MSRAFTWQRVMATALTLASLAVLLYVLGAPGYTGG